MLARITPGLDLWDHWPVLDEAGDLAELAGGLLVVALSAPVLPDPDARHAVARLRLFHRGPWGWRDLGDLMPEGHSPGSREWAGSAVFDRPSRRLTLYFTAAGRRGEGVVRFDQRLHVTSTVLDEGLEPLGWTPPIELVRPDGIDYETEMEGGGAIGTIKAFRDPFVFRCPQDGRERLLFTGSRANAGSDWNGVIGLARRDGEGWILSPPLVDATGINNELERPHAVEHDGRTYLFWSTQAHVFAPGISAPTGLYGLVADRAAGRWLPLNGHGLVFANPDRAPEQAYSWQVLPDLSVWSFANLVGLSVPPADTRAARAAFAGQPAPTLRVELQGDRAALAPGGPW